MICLLLISFIILLISGVPVIFSLSGATLITFALLQPHNFLTIPQILFAANDSFALLAIPFFILAGNLMEYSGISKRLVAFCEKVVGGVTGGLGVVVILSCLFFGAISGSAPATVAAIGAILIPAMIQRGYPKPWSAALVATSGTLGAILPPSIPMILYGVLSGTSISALFTAGILPGILIAVCFIIYTLIYCHKNKIDRTSRSSLQDILKSGCSAFWALLMPIIILGGIYSGVFTPTESAALASVYGLIIGLFVYKELKLKQLPKILLSSAETSSIILLLITTSAAFSILLIRDNVPLVFSHWISNFSQDPAVFLLLFSVAMILWGTFMSVLPALIILTPMLAPAAQALGINNVHFGLIFIFLLQIGSISPPLGVDLFTVCGISRLEFGKIVQEIWKFLLIYALALVLLITFPSISLYLPNLLGLG